MSKLTEAYEDGRCPDCCEDIPEDAIDGSNCLNCGHVFWTAIAPSWATDKEE